MSFWSFKEKKNSLANPVEEVLPEATNESDINKDEKYRRLRELTKDLPKIKRMIGYKAVDHNYQAFYGDHPKYEIGQEYIIKGRLKPCSNGFHFCQSLEDVIHMFPPQKGHHYLKVAGEVPVEYYFDDNDNLQERFKSCASIMYQEAQMSYITTNKWQGPFSPHIFCTTPPTKEYFFDCDLDKKFITPKMTILEEIPFNQYAEYAYNELIDSEEKYYNTISFADYTYILTNKIIEYSEKMFSDAFIHYWIYNVYFKNNENLPDSPKARCLQCLKDFKQKFDVIKDENISQDIKVLFMLEKI